MSQKQKYDKTEKEEKVTAKENYTESSLEQNHLALEPEKKK